MAEMLPNTLRSIVLTGDLMPVHLDGQPVLVEMPDCRGLFVTIFSSEEKLREQMQLILPGQPYKIKKITDGQEFCESIWEHNIRIMRDPYVTDGNKTHWTEVMKDGEVN
jgi:hypothetical protein